jgi:ABC-2 type transport system permease protein
MRRRLEWRRAGVLARGVHNLHVVGALGRRSIRQTFRRPQFLAPIVVFPTLLLAVNTGGAGRAVDLPGFPHVHGFLDFELAGSLTQSTMLAGVSGGIALALDIELGFIDRLIAAPIARGSIVVGRLTATAIMGALAALWFIAIGLVFGARVAGGAGGALVVIALAALAASAFGGLAAALALWTGRASVVQGIFPLVFVGLFLSSAFFPRQLLLEPAGTVARWNPLSFVAEGLRAPIVTGVSPHELLAGLAGVAIVGAIALAATAAALRSRLRSGS